MNFNQELQPDNESISPFRKGGELESKFIKIKEAFYNKPIQKDLQSLLGYYKDNYKNKREVSWLNNWEKVLYELNKHFANTTPDIKSALDIISDTIRNGQNELNTAREYFRDKLEKNEQSWDDGKYMYSRDVVSKGSFGELDKLNAALINKFLDSLKEKFKWSKELQDDYNSYIDYLKEYPAYFPNNLNKDY